MIRWMDLLGCVCRLKIKKGLVENKTHKNNDKLQSLAAGLQATSSCRGHMQSGPLSLHHASTNISSTPATFIVIFACMPFSDVGVVNYSLKTQENLTQCTETHRPLSPKPWPSEIAKNASF